MALVATGLCAPGARELLAQGVARADARTLAATFPVAPLDTPLVVTGMFGERRPRHFHAGLDLSTGGVVGWPVRAPMNGWIERLRTQGAGYGRSLYLHTSDGRLVVLGHLEAFAEPAASTVAAAQDSSGLYEQDLWLPRDRMPVKAGALLAWSGASGTSRPHLHVEVRRGDMAINPLRAGIPVRDPLAPEVRTVTLEPLDEESWAERGAGPLTRPMAQAVPETLLVEGRMRAIVRAVDPGERGAALAPWRLRETWRDRWIEWRADSASWVTDMADVDYVYDVGRAAPGGAAAIQLWAPAGWRPAVLRTNVPDSLAAGVIEVARGDPPRALRFEVEDAAGQSRECVLWLRGPGERERGPAPLGSGQRGSSTAASPVRGSFEFMSLPGGNLRVMLRGAPADLRSGSLLGGGATWRDGAWSVILSRQRFVDVLRPHFEGTRAGGEAWADSARPLAIADVGALPARSKLSPLEWRLEARAAFEPAVLLFDVVGRPLQGDAELVPLSDAYAIEPAALPLRAAMSLRLDPRRGALDARAGLYVDGGSGWEWLGGRDPANPAVAAGESRQLGRFAVFADTLAPRVLMLRPPRRAPGGPFSRWALRARVTELGSGVDPRSSFFEVDGRRVPTEYDGVRNTLQWRPRAAPARGTHRVTVEARDLAGNARRSTGTFVLD